MKKKKMFYLLVTIVALLVAFISGTYAYFMASVVNNSVIAGTVASLALKLDVVKVTSGEGLIPLAEKYLSAAAQSNCIDINGYTACQVYKITLTNQGNTNIYVDGYVTITSSTSINLKWTELSNATTYEGSNTRGMKRSLLVVEDKIGANSSKDYYIMIYLNETGEEQNATDSGSFGGIIEFNTTTGTIVETLDGNSLYNKIREQAVADDMASTYVSASTGIDFTQNSSLTNGKGVYALASTASDDYPIYYYRGDVENNNVIFGNFCWKIVRTTETGGIKLIYNGTPTDGACNNTGEATQIGTSMFNPSYTSPAYGGYMYGNVYNIEYRFMNDTDTYYYGNSVTYENGTYTLVNNISGTWTDVYEDGLNNNHYTCFSTGTTCNEVYYVFINNENYAYYITLNEVDSIETALDEMLNNNTTSSTIKGNYMKEGSLDWWYYNNLNDYAIYIEDTVFCNDRSIYSLGGFNPNGGVTYPTEDVSTMEEYIS